jgi:hypothetical protein
MDGVAKKEVNPLEFSNNLNELPGLIMRNYLVGFEIGISLWKKSFEFLIYQMNQWAEVQEEYNDMLKSLYGKSTFEIMSLSESPFNKLTKDTIKTVEKNWFFLNDCINLMLDLD